MSRPDSAEQRLDGEEQSLLVLLTDTQAAMSRLFERRARDLGLNRSQWRVAGAINREPGRTQKQLSDWLGIAPSPIGKIIDRLERDGLVERRADTEDRRINRLYPTAAIVPIVEPAMAISEQLEGEVLARLSGAGKLKSALAALKQRLEAIEGDEPQAG